MIGQTTSKSSLQPGDQMFLFLLVYTLLSHHMFLSSAAFIKKKIDNSIDFFSHADETKFSVFRLRNVWESLVKSGLV